MRIGREAASIAAAIGLGIATIGFGAAVKASNSRLASFNQEITSKKNDIVRSFGLTPELLAEAVNILEVDALISPRAIPFFEDWYSRHLPGECQDSRVSAAVVRACNTVRTVHGRVDEYREKVASSGIPELQRKATGQNGISTIIMIPTLASGLGTIYSAVSVLGSLGSRIRRSYLRTD